MSCQPYLDLISAQLDGALTQDDSRSLTAHLDTCPHCRAIARDLAGLHTAMEDLSVPVPESLSQGVLDRIRRDKPSRKPLLRSWATLAACLLLTVGVLRVADAGRPTVQDPGVPMTARTLGPEGQPAAMSDTLPMEDIQTTRVSWGQTPAAPSAVILADAESLAQYLTQFPQDQLSHLTQQYNDAFFRDHQLLAVVVEANSGSIVHALDPDSLTQHSVTVTRHAPQERTDDMAAWLLTAQVDKAFANGQQLEVLFAD